MIWSRMAALVGALVAFAPTPEATAQGDLRKCANTEFAARTVPLGDYGPFAGASLKAEDYHDVKGPRCRVITFYRVPAAIPGATTPSQIRRVMKDYVGKSATPFLAARYVDDNRAANYVERWTDQAACPALIPALETLEPILAPKITGDGPYRGLDVAGPEGPNVRLWMAGQVYPQANADFTLNYSLDGGHGTALGAWLDETLAALDACWKTEAPSIP